MSALDNMDDLMILVLIVAGMAAVALFYTMAGQPPKVWAAAILLYGSGLATLFNLYYSVKATRSVNEGRMADARKYSGRAKWSAFGAWLALIVMTITISAFKYAKSRGGRAGRYAKKAERVLNKYVGGRSDSGDQMVEMSELE